MAPKDQAISLMEELWAVEDSCPSPDDPRVLAKAKGTAENLRGVLALGVGSMSPLEEGHILRFLGDALLTASGTKDNDLLHRAHEAYARAEQCYNADDDPVEYAKLRFNHGNALFLLNGGSDIGALRHARQCYNDSRVLSAEHLPERLDAVYRSLEAIEGKIQLVEFTQQMEDENVSLERMHQRLLDAGDDDEKVAEVGREFEAHRRKGREEAAVSRLGHLMGQLGSLSEDPGFQRTIAEKQAELGRMKTDLSDALGSELSEDAKLFNMAFDEIAKARESGEIDDNREETLRDMLSQFQDASGGGNAPEEMSDRLRRMRSVIDRYKPLFEKGGGKGSV